MADEPELARKTTQALAINTTYDYCQVGDDIVPYDIVCDLSGAVSHSPNVWANDEPVLTVSHRIQGVQGNQGQGIDSGVSGQDGYVELIRGSSTVHINGKAAVRHGDECLMNCNADGTPNCRGRVYTRQVPYEPMSAENKAWYEQAAAESRRVLQNQWESLKEDLTTVWEATGLSSSQAQAAAARTRILEGAADFIEVMDVLSGPELERVVQAGSMYAAAVLAGDPVGEAVALQELAEQHQRLERQVNAVGAVYDGMANAVLDAYERNGPAGAGAMVLTVLGTAAVGGKGSRGLLQTAGTIADTIRRAKTPLESVQALDHQIQLARKAGVSPDQIKLMEEARDKRRIQARREAGHSPGDGVVILRPRARPRCFSPQKLPEQKLAEMDLQLQEQQNAINLMTADEFWWAREMFKQMKRNPAAQVENQRMRGEFSENMNQRLVNELQAQGMSRNAATTLAASQTAEALKKMNALHIPDMSSGGFFQPGPERMGDAQVNQTIGRQWSKEGRLQSMDDAAQEAIERGQGKSKMSVKLERCKP